MEPLSSSTYIESNRNVKNNLDKIKEIASYLYARTCLVIKSILFDTSVAV